MSQPQQHDGFGNQRRPNQGGRGAYSPALDDRANFIEYVRGLEQQGGHAPPRGHSQNHQGGRGGRGGRGGQGGGGGRGPGGRGGRPNQDRNFGGGRPQNAHGGPGGGGREHAGGQPEVGNQSAPPQANPASFASSDSSHNDGNS